MSSPFAQAERAARTELPTRLTIVDAFGILNTSTYINVCPVNVEVPIQLADPTSPPSSIASYPEGVNCSSRAGRADHIEIGERRDFHHVSGLRGVNDHSSSDVHTHVTQVDFEEDEIPGLQRV